MRVRFSQSRMVFRILRTPFPCSFCYQMARGEVFAILPSRKLIRSCIFYNKSQGNVRSETVRDFSENLFIPSEFSERQHTKEGSGGPSGQDEPIQPRRPRTDIQSIAPRSWITNGNVELDCCLIFLCSPTFPGSDSDMPRI